MRRVKVFVAVLLSACVFLTGLFFSVRLMRNIRDYPQQSMADYEQTENVSEKNERAGEGEAEENEEENGEISSRFIEIMADNMHNLYSTAVYREDCLSVTGLTPTCPAYLPENFKQYGLVFIEEDMIRHYWYNTQDYAILAINEYKTARLPDPNDESGKYLYVDLVYPHDGFQYAAMRDEIVDGTEIQGYMLFAEESYEPECRKIIDSVFDAED